MSLATVYATDENLAVRAPGDFQALCPDWQVLARGADGAFSSGAPWVLTSTGTDFGAQGVAAGMVVALTGPKAAFRGSGELLAVESVAGSSVTLRRVGALAGTGLPPGAGGLSGVTFQVATLGPQIEEASFDLNRRFNIDPAIPGRAPADVYDLRDLRQATVLTVLRSRYQADQRGERGDWPRKAAAMDQELSEVLARLSIRWSHAPDNRTTNWFSTRIVR